MPIKKRKRKLIDDYPHLGEPRPVSLERWIRHRERLMARSRAGRRPQEWWEYEAPIPYPGYDDETVALYEAGLLSDDELAELMPWWRQQYDRAQASGFSFCSGYDSVRHCGVFLNGAAARRALYRWAQIPPAVVKEWDRARVAAS